MHYTNLGRTGCKVSRLCLGTMNFGVSASEADSHALMNRALEVGLNFWDTADVYGHRPHEGYTEQIIGNFFAGSPKAREQVVLATKYQGTMGVGPNDRGASAYHIRAACDASLVRLRTDRIDLYQMHHVNRDCPWDEVYEALDVLRQQGKIIYAGCSNFAGWHIAEAIESARRLHVLGLVSEQSKFSLNCRYIELEVLPACRHYGLGVIPWSPLDGGYLAGVLGQDKGVRRASEGMQKRIARNRGQLEKWESFCAQVGHAPADVALAWVLHVPGITAPIIGPRTLEQLDGNVRALDIHLSPEQLARIDEIFPPVGHPDIQPTSKSPHKYESPEAYAW